MYDLEKGEMKAWITHLDSTLSNRRVRAAVDILPTSDFTGVVRYRLLETIETGIQVHIARGSQEIEGSPVKIRGPLYHFKCKCPYGDMAKWYKALECPIPLSKENDFYSQLYKDLEPFSGGIDMRRILKDTVEKMGKSRYTHSFCHYAVVKNRIYRKCYGEHVGFNMFTDAILTELVRRVQLPDLEFISNLGDWPLSKPTNDPLLPIVSWCGSDSTVDITLPTYDITESTLHMLDRVSLDMISTRANTGPKWDAKVNKAFFRGRDSRQERLELLNFSRKKKT